MASASLFIKCMGVEDFFFPNCIPPFMYQIKNKKKYWVTNSFFSADILNDTDTPKRFGFFLNSYSLTFQVTYPIKVWVWVTLPHPLILTDLLHGHTLAGFQH